MRCFFKAKSMQKNLGTKYQSLKIRSVNNLELPLIKRKYIRQQFFLEAKIGKELDFENITDV